MKPGRKTGKMKTKTDYPFFVEIPAEEYHQAARDGKFLSSHLLGDFRKCPLLYHQKMTGEIQPTDSAAFWMGRAVHALVCEGRSAFDREFIVSDGPVNPKTGEVFGKLSKAYREWAAVQTLTPVSTTDFGFMVKLQSAVYLHPIATRLLQDGWAEGTVRTEYRGERVQIRVDYFNPNFTDDLTGERGAIVDLKTCDAIDFFEADARRYGYIHQLAFYREALRIVSGVDYPVFIIAVEKRAPFRVGVWKIASAALDDAKSANDRAIDLLRECRRTATWPTGYEDMRVLDFQ